jgi:hypothetical protein
MTRCPFIVVVALAVCIASPVFAQDAHVGTWKQSFDRPGLREAVATLQGAD